MAEAVSLSVRAFAASQWRVYRDLRLRALDDAPDAFGSTLAAEEAAGDEHWRDRLAAGVVSPRRLPLVALRGAAPVGTAWGVIDERDPALAHLYGMWVAPEARRSGAARMLLDTIVRWAADQGARCLELSVTEGNAPAERLYARAGLVRCGQSEPLRPGSTLVQHTYRVELAPHQGRGLPPQP